MALPVDLDEREINGREGGREGGRETEGGREREGGREAREGYKFSLSLPADVVATRICLIPADDVDTSGRQLDLI